MIVALLKIFFIILSIIYIRMYALRPVLLAIGIQKRLSFIAVHTSDEELNVLLKLIIKKAVRDKWDFSLDLTAWAVESAFISGALMKISEKDIKEALNETSNKRRGE